MRTPQLRTIKTLLQKKKYQLLKQQQATQFGNLGLLAQDGQALVVIEVSPAGQISSERQSQLSLIAATLYREYQVESVRVDLILLDEKESKIRHRKGIVKFHGGYR